MTGVICIGDVITLYSESVSGYIHSVHTSKEHNALVIKPNQDREAPDIPDVQVVGFEVCCPNRYKFNKLLRRSESKLSDSTSSEARVLLNDVRENARTEEAANNSEQNKARGSWVVYGQIIQLRHVFTNKFIHSSNKCMAHLDNDTMQVELQTHNAKQSLFRLMPRYKVCAEGDVIRTGDQVALESVKSPGQYLNVSSVVFPVHSDYPGCHEVDLGVYQSSFTLNCISKNTMRDCGFLRGGSIIRLFHKEIDAYLTAEGQFGAGVSQDVHLRVREQDISIPKTMFPSTSAITYWQIELQESSLIGDPVKWLMPCRLKHMCTQLFLCQCGDGLSLSDDRNDPNTVFRLHPLVNSGEEVELNANCRIEHVLSDGWLHASSDGIKRSTHVMGKQTAFSDIPWTTAVMRQVGLSAEMQFVDAFTIQAVTDKERLNFNFVAGYVPLLQTIIKNAPTNKLDVKRAFSYAQALQELQDFCDNGGQPCKDRQKIIRNLMCIRSIVAALHIDWASESRYADNVLVQLYGVLKAYSCGDSRKNELYLARHIEFFFRQISKKGILGQKATEMLTELIRDNRKIVDRITEDKIKNVAKLVYQRKDFRYLDLMSVLCVCNDVSIVPHQNQISRVWLGARKKSVFLTELGQAVGRDSNVIYVSTDNGKQWTPLHEFADEHTNGERMSFLNSQLDLMAKLCQGRNTYAMEVITNKLSYLTWSEALICLTNSQLPDSLRAKYCNLIIALFVDVPGNVALVKNAILTFVYDDLTPNVENKVIADASVHSRQQSERLNLLEDWISQFLAENQYMVASEIGRNKLIKQVLRLVRLLVMYGLYDKIESVEKLMIPLHKLLDGRNDLSTPTEHSSLATQKETDNFKTSGRFKQTPENIVVFEAKYQAMEVLSLLLLIQFNRRHMRFAHLFKSIGSASHTMDKETLMTRLLSTDFTHNEKLSQLAKRELADIITSTSIFKNYDIDDVLMDISQYDSEELICKSTQLQLMFNSAHENLFRRATQAKILITATSVGVLNEVHKLEVLLRSLGRASIFDKQGETICKVLDSLIGMCMVEGDISEPHHTNQTIIWNNSVHKEVFTLLSRDIDLKQTRYDAARRVREKCFVLLRQLTRDNHVVKQSLFLKLDFLLGVQGAEAEMGDTIAEIFTDNKANCLKVARAQLQKMVHLASQHNTRAPRLLNMLRAVVKVEELDLPLERNQDFVIKYVTQYWNDICRGIDASKDYRNSTALGKESGDQDYMLGFIDLLAACAEGENSFIESMCQTIMSVEEILDVLVHDEASHRVKRVYLRFLVWTYLRTKKRSEALRSNPITSDKRMWIFVTKLNEIMDELTSNAIKHGDKVTPLINTKSDDRVSPEDAHCHGALRFVFDAVLPFLEAVDFSDSEQDDSGTHVDSLFHTYVDFYKAIGPLTCDDINKKSLLNCFNILSSVATAPSNGARALQISFKKTSALNVKTPLRQKYEKYYLQEEELNRQFNTFATNYRIIFGGQNTVRAQTGHPSDNEYTKQGCDEELPLGPEFQSLVNVYGSTNETGIKAHRAMKLIEYLGITGRERKRKHNNSHHIDGTIDAKCVMILRGIIHNEVVKLPSNWDTYVLQNKKQLQKIASVQSALCQHGAVVNIAQHLSASVTGEMVTQVLAFLADILFSGNEDAQDSLYQYFLANREERFFVTLKSKMQLAALDIKEKLSMQEKYNELVGDTPERVQQVTHTRLKRHRKHAPPVGKVEPSSPLPVSSKMGAVGSQMDTFDVMISRDSIGFQTDQEIAGKEDGNLELMLKTLGRICDGQNTPLQDYLREQSDNFVSVDLVAEAVQLLDTIASDINGVTIRVICELMQTLVEFASGNIRNQHVLFDCRICDFIDVALRMDSFSGSSPRLVLQLKKNMGKLITVMSEDNSLKSGEESTNLSKLILDNIDEKCIAAVMFQCYHDSTKRKSDKRLYDEVGFQYFHILCRMDEMDTNDNGQRLLTEILEEEGYLSVWQYYDSKSMSVEIVKDGCIQKIHFPVKDKGALREESKVAFNYGVSRDEGERVSSFMEWSASLKTDITYTRWIQSNPITRSIVSSWFYMNISMMLLSFILCIFQIAFWKAPADYSSWEPVIEYQAVRVLSHILLVVHNIVTVTVALAFILIRRPRFPPFSRLKSLWSRVTGLWRWMRKLENEDVQSDQTEPNSSEFLTTYVFSFITFWYLSLVMTSIASHFLHGYLVAYHLLHMAECNQMIKRAICAISKNGLSLLMISLFSLVFIYIFGQINFAFYRELFNGGEGLYCRSMYECVVSTFHHGYIVGLFEGIPLAGGESFQYGLMKALLDMCFFLVISIIFLNIVFGIIVDTFAELRDEKWQADKDMRDSCFICGIDSYDFEKKPGGFEEHVKKDHNQWAYVFFFLYLDESRQNDFTSLELFVSRKLARDEYDFLPINEAMCLGNNDGDKMDQLNVLELRLNYVVGCMKAIDMESKKAKELLRLQHWEDQQTRSDMAVIKKKFTVVQETSIDVKDATASGSASEADDDEWEEENWSINVLPVVEEVSDVHRQHWPPGSGGTAPTITLTTIPSDDEHDSHDGEQK